MADTQTVPDLTGAAGAAQTPGGNAAVFLGVSGSADPDRLREAGAALHASGALGGVPLTLAYPGAESVRTPVDGNTDLLTYPLPSAEGASSASPWAQTSAAESALLSLAGESGAQAAVLLHPDLQALTPQAVEALVRPVLARERDLVMGSYTLPPFDGLFNHGLLAPLTRALYGKRVRYPLAPDFAASARLMARLAVAAHSRASTATPILWPATVAAGIDGAVSEVSLPIQHARAASDMDLTSVIAQLAGSVYAEMEAHAPLWQRVRPSAQNGGHAATFRPGEAQTAAAEVDTAPMIKSFLLASRSLQDVWGLLLPPVTLLDLKRLSLLTGEAFRMPDELWVRIVYDFALGHRLRTINRKQLLGALTPLYLGWVASFVNEAVADPGFDPAARQEKLARAFEDGKPYLVRRWRWPDRFNP